MALSRKEECEVILVKKMRNAMIGLASGLQSIRALRDPAGATSGMAQLLPVAAMNKVFNKFMR